jgi:type IV pilus assembly protein PilY1
MNILCGSISMRSHRKICTARLLGVGLLTLVAIDAYPLDLADAPLFLTTPVEPNLMLVIDDSGSMDSEVLMPANDGALWWHTGDQSFVGRDSDDQLSTGVINYNYVGTADNTWKKYVYIFPIDTGLGRRIYGDSTNDHYAIPPRPEYAFARSAEYNKAFYDPLKTYLPWSSSYGTTFADATPTAARTDPVRGTATLNLTANINRSDGNWTFRLQPGMRNAAGTVVAAVENATFDYYPATYYVVTDASLGYDGTRSCSSPTNTDYAAFVANPSILPSGVDAIAPDGKCLVKYEVKAGRSFPRGRTYDEEMQNFANWFTYHRKRHLGMRGGILSAFSDLSGFRAGLFTLNNRVSPVPILDFDTQKTNFLNTLQNFVGSGGTPTREALKHAGDQYLRTDASAPITEYCQKNFSIVFTDGFATPLPAGVPDVDNEDGSEGTPYADTFSDTLGDIAMKFYRDNLRPDLTAGEVQVSPACPNAPPPDDEDGMDEPPDLEQMPTLNPLLDCNRDLHMVTFAVGLGVRGNIFGVTHNTRADAFDPANPDNPITWQEPNILRNPVQVDDLYHATINGRGQMLNATTPDEISLKMRAVMEAIRNEIGSSSATAANSTSLQTDSQIFQARFDSSDWSGQLLAYNLDDSGNIEDPAAWDAGDEINGQSAASRDILTYGRDSRDGIPFTWDAISAQGDATQATSLNTDAFGTLDNLGLERVAFLRGEEVTGFRTRSSKLGDIVYSSPLYVGSPRGRHPGESYGDFIIANRDRDPIIYVGANDGMLHGFDLDTGEERVAYVPGPVYPNLSHLTDPDYGNENLPHRYFVDGSPMSADIEFGDDWMTVLLGGLNAGGQGYYALDVTDPDDFSEVDAADLVLWEFTDEDDADLGFSYNSPPIEFVTGQSSQIAKMNNGEWALIVGNGYNSTQADGHASATGHAALFVLFIEDGADGTWDSGDYVKIDTGAGTTDAPNGLATPRPMDIDGDGDVDVAYAGDLEGNLWKFDLTSATAGSWTARHLFSAVNDDSVPQPITSAPVAVRHPDGGYMVSFGTGKYLERTDVENIDVQTFYGIWDNRIDGSVVEVTGRDQLVEQKVLAVVPVNGYDYRITSDNAVDYAEKRGWYMDLPTTGERVVFNPIVRPLRTVFVTLIPIASDPCAGGGSGWVMELDYLSGARFRVSPFDVNGDFTISDLDLVTFTPTEGEPSVSVTVGGVNLGGGIPTTPTVLALSGQEGELKFVSGTKGGIGKVFEFNPDDYGRISWRQILGE